MGADFAYVGSAFIATEEARAAAPLRPARHLAPGEEHDPHAVLLDGRGESARQPAARCAHPQLQAHRRAGRGNDGLGDRLRHRQGGTRGRPDGRGPAFGQQGQGLLGQAARRASGQGKAHGGEARRDARADQGDRRLRAARRLRAGDRGGVREARPQGGGHPQGGGRARSRRGVRFQHLDPADHGARRSLLPACAVRRHALLLAGRAHATGRGDPRQVYERRHRGAGDGPGQAPAHDADRGQ